MYLRTVSLLAILVLCQISFMEKNSIVPVQAQIIVPNSKHAEKYDISELDFHDAKYQVDKNPNTNLQRCGFCSWFCCGHGFQLFKISDKLGSIVMLPMDSNLNNSTSSSSSAVGHVFNRVVVTQQENYTTKHIFLRDELKSESVGRMGQTVAKKIPIFKVSSSRKAQEEPEDGKFFLGRPKHADGSNTNFEIEFGEMDDEEVEEYTHEINYSRACLKGWFCISLFSSIIPAFVLIFGCSNWECFKKDSLTVTIPLAVLECFGLIGLIASCKTCCVLDRAYSIFNSENLVTNIEVHDLKTAKIERQRQDHLILVAAALFIGIFLVFFLIYGIAKFLSKVHFRCTSLRDSFCEFWGDIFCCCCNPCSRRRRKRCRRRIKSCFTCFGCFRSCGDCCGYYSFSRINTYDDDDIYTPSQMLVKHGNKLLLVKSDQGYEPFDYS